MIAACFFLLSIFGANLVNANELNLDKLATTIDSIISDVLADDVNIGANFKQAAQPILKKTLHALATDNIAEVTQSILDIVSTLGHFLDDLKNLKGSSSQDISIPVLDIVANSKTIGQIQTALRSIVKLNAKVKGAAASFKIVNGKLYATKAQSQGVLAVMKALTAQYKALKVALADFQKDLLNLAIAALQDNDNAFAPYLFKNVANVAAATSKAYAAIESSLVKTTVQYKLLVINYTKNGVLIIPATKANAIDDALLKSIGGEWDSNANALAILADNIEASS